jgi:hypothetical protein
MFIAPQLNSSSSITRIALVEFEIYGTFYNPRPETVEPTLEKKSVAADAALYVCTAASRLRQTMDHILGIEI